MGSCRMAVTDTIFVSTCSYAGFTEAEFILGCASFLTSNAIMFSRIS